jgi:hypothetical protein
MFNVQCSMFNAGKCRDNAKGKPLAELKPGT